MDAPDVAWCVVSYSSSTLVGDDDLGVDLVFGVAVLLLQDGAEGCDHGNDDAGDEDQQDDIFCGGGAVFVIVKLNKHVSERVSHDVSFEREGEVIHIIFLCKGCAGLVIN